MTAAADSRRHHAVQRMALADVGALIAAAAARAIAPRQHTTVAEWAARHRALSRKASPEPGPWRNERNPPLVEPMNCLSARSPVRDIVCMFPIQFGKTEIALNGLGYTMSENPGPVMVCLPGEVSMGKWISQKLNPMLDETPAVQRTLDSVASRDARNRQDFKDYEGGQLYIEHAGSTARLKSTTVRTLLVDEVDEFAANLTSGDDPIDMLDGRTSAWPSQYKRLYISTPTLAGSSRIETLFKRSDQRHYHVDCPDCGHDQPLEWAGLKWTKDGSQAWYECRACSHVIQEHQKTDLIAAGRWVAHNPESRRRGYTINALYYPLGLGPRWADLVTLWLDSQGDAAKLKTFINDRLAQVFEDRTTANVKHNLIADRAEPYRLRIAPRQVLAITAGVDTQDNRLAVHILGWGRGLRCWVLDYIELPGDPAEPEVWATLTQLLNRPIEREDGALLSVMATAIDAGGHRTEDVKHYVRSRLIRRPMCIFGAVPANAPVLSRPKLQDVNWRGRLDKRGVQIQHVGTVAIKHRLFAWLSADGGEGMEPEKRMIHFSDDLDLGYFTGLTSEVFNPSRNRFELRRGVRRNEVLDTWVYAYAATHHHELRLHRYSRADWDRLEANHRGRLEEPHRAIVDLGAPAMDGAEPAADSPPPDHGFGSESWGQRW